VGFQDRHVVRWIDGMRRFPCLPHTNGCDALTQGQIWDLFEGASLFHAAKDGCLNDEQHLAEMVSLLGPPPKAFLARSTKCGQYWDSDGNVTHLTISHLHMWN
jgi:hypothetical protein